MTLSVDDLVKLYAEAVAREMTDSDESTFKRRVELHDKLCKALKVDRDEFKPFEFGEGITWTSDMAERMIRIAMREMNR